MLSAMASCERGSTSCENGVVQHDAGGEGGIEQPGRA